MTLEILSFIEKKIIMQIALIEWIKDNKMNQKGEYA
jgi:hypothetical protein